MSSSFHNLGSHKFSRSVSQQSLHSKSSTSSIVVKSGKGDPHRLKNYSQESFASRCQRNKVNKSIGLSSATSKTMSEFESKLASTTMVTISTKLKRGAEFPLIGKTGYRVSLNAETVGLLVSPSEKGCCGGTPDRNENDPLNYYLVSLSGEELINIHGLDGTTLENHVEVTTSALKTKLGSIEYGYLGADGEALSKATTLAGRGNSYTVPTSVMNEAGVMAYIFRREQDNPAYTEVITADGDALTVAEVILNFKNTGGRRRFSTVSRGRMMEGTPDSFSLNFLEAVGEKEKMLLIGTTVTLFNQWLTRQTQKKVYCVVQ